MARHLTSEHKAKISLAMLSKKRSPQSAKHRAAIGLALSKKEAAEKTFEHRAAITASRLAEKGTPEWEKEYEFKLGNLRYLYRWGVETKKQLEREKAQHPGFRELRSVEGFWENVVVTERGCWEWQGPFWVGPQPQYGRCWFYEKNDSAHRVAWMLKHRKKGIPQGKMICHHCDNPPCIRPKHLYLGTAQDNANDTKARRRGEPRPPLIAR